MQGNSRHGGFGTTYRTWGYIVDKCIQLFKTERDDFEHEPLSVRLESS